MASVPNFAKQLAAYLGLEEPYVVGVARYLREDGLLTQGARGRNAPEATPLDAARLLIALLCGGKANRATNTVRLFGSFEASDFAGSQFSEAANFENALARAIEFMGMPVEGRMHESQQGQTVMTITVAASIWGVEWTEGKFNFGFVPQNHDKMLKWSHQNPAGLREQRTITNQELLKIGRFVCLNKPFSEKFFNWIDE
jgi:hypothetical protein